MRKLLLLLLLICSCSLQTPCRRADDLFISVTLVRGERSRDSNSKTTTITLEGNAIIYVQTRHGAGAGRLKPIRKEFKLSGEDKKRLVGLIDERNLLVTDGVEYPAAESGIRHYFEISVRLLSNGKKGAITIKGPTNAVAVKEEKLYKAATALIEELYRIINLTDEQITYEELLN